MENIIHYETFRKTACGIKVPDDRMAWHYASVNCKACRRTKFFKKDFKFHQICVLEELNKTT